MLCPRSLIPQQRGLCWSCFTKGETEAWSRDISRDICSIPTPLANIFSAQGAAVPSYGHMLCANHCLASTTGPCWPVELAPGVLVLGSGGGEAGWGCTALRGGLPEGHALPGYWRAARASRRCARRRAGRSAAAGTPGWLSRCSGPFGIRQCAPNRNRTAGDRWLCPGPRVSGSGHCDEDGGGTRTPCEGEKPPPAVPGHWDLFSSRAEGIWLHRALPTCAVYMCTCVFHGGLVPHGMLMARK